MPAGTPAARAPVQQVGVRAARPAVQPVGAQVVRTTTQPTGPQTAVVRPSVSAAGHPVRVNPASGKIFTYHGRSLPRFRAVRYHYAAGTRYSHYSPRDHFPVAALAQMAADVIQNWVDYQLNPPPASEEWVRFGPDALLVDTTTGFVADAVYDSFDEDDPLPDQGTAPSPFYWVGIATSPSGAWATRGGRSEAEATDAALLACNQSSGNQCTPYGTSVSGETYRCWALTKTANSAWPGRFNFGLEQASDMAGINQMQANCLAALSPERCGEVMHSACNDR